MAFQTQENLQIRSPDGCEGNSVPSTVVRGYDFHKPGGYLPGASDTSTSALDTARDRTGVCRDFAHLAIALCRAMGIPARFVTGYAWGLVMPDFHACMEAFLAGRWHLFDPSRKVATDRMVRIGTGRDAADASFATIFGDGRPSELTAMAVFAEPAPDETPATTARRRA
ncbi:MAG: transglutaminase family protein [Proteobacteria bacterium]|nr:transglutaminase family protein [Pseudomonadota bacterium]